MDTSTVDLKFATDLLRLPYSQIWSDYDERADVLYLSFEKPQRADDSVMEADGNIYHYRGDRLVGITLPNARTRFCADG